MFTFVSNIREFTQDKRNAVDDKLNKIAQQVTALAQNNPSDLTASVKMMCYQQSITIRIV